MNHAEIMFGFTVAIIVSWYFGFLCGILAHRHDMRAAQRERESPR